MDLENENSNYCPEQAVFFVGKSVKLESLGLQVKRVRNEMDVTQQFSNFSHFDFYALNAGINGKYQVDVCVQSSIFLLRNHFAN